MITARHLPVLAAAAILCAALAACDPPSPEDRAIGAEVESRLADSSALADDQISVQVRNHVVYLSGLVDTTGEQGIAESIAQDVPGVAKVIDSTQMRAANY